MNWNDYTVDVNLTITPADVSEMIYKSLTQADQVDFIVEVLSGLDEKHQEQFKDWFDEWWEE